MPFFDTRLDAYIHEHMPKSYAVDGDEHVWHYITFAEFASKWLRFLAPDFGKESVSFSVMDYPDDNMIEVRVPNDMPVGLRWDGHGTAHDADPECRSFIEYELIFKLVDLYSIDNGLALEHAIDDVFSQHVLHSETISLLSPEPIVHFPVPGGFIRSENYEHLYGAVMFHSEAVIVRDAYLKILDATFALLEPVEVSK